MPYNNFYFYFFLVFHISIGALWKGVSVVSVYGSPSPRITKVKGVAMLMTLIMIPCLNTLIPIIIIFNFFMTVPYFNWSAVETSYCGFRIRIPLHQDYKSQVDDDDDDSDVDDNVSMFKYLMPYINFYFFYNCSIFEFEGC